MRGYKLYCCKKKDVSYIDSSAPKRRGVESKQTAAGVCGHAEFLWAGQTNIGSQKPEQQQTWPYSTSRQAPRNSHATWLVLAAMDGPDPLRFAAGPCGLRQPHRQGARAGLVSKLKCMGGAAARLLQRNGCCQEGTAHAKSSWISLRAAGELWRCMAPGVMARDSDSSAQGKSFRALLTLRPCALGRKGGRGSRVGLSRTRLIRAMQRDHSIRQYPHLLCTITDMCFRARVTKPNRALVQFSPRIRRVKLCVQPDRHMHPDVPIRPDYVDCVSEHSKLTWGVWVHVTLKSRVDRNGTREGHGNIPVGASKLLLS